MPYLSMCIILEELYYALFTLASYESALAMCEKVMHFPELLAHTIKYQSGSYAKVLP